MREIDQLRRAAGYYLSQAKKTLDKKPELRQKKLKEITKYHRQGKLSYGETALADLASASVRMVTVCEKKSSGNEICYRIKYYRNGKRKNNGTKKTIKNDINNNLEHHIHMLLRDNIAHVESGYHNKQDIAEDRMAVLKELTISKCEESLIKKFRSI